MADQEKNSQAVNEKSVRSEAPEMNDEQFRLWCALLEQRTGIRLSSEQRKIHLETSVFTRMREIGIQAYDDYFVFLRDGAKGKVEWSVLVDRLTVQETHFFRHKGSYELARDMITEMLASKSEENPLDIWSVGCSTGEEPYSLAILCDEQASLLGNNVLYGVTATDISIPALEKAKKGIYSVNRLFGLEQRRREKYFSEIEKNKFQVIKKIKDRVGFGKVNVMELRKSPMENFDLIFCQNLLIYFSRWRKRDILNCLAERLIPGGVLVLGLGEAGGWNHPRLSRVPYENSLAFIRQE